MRPGEKMDKMIVTTHIHSSSATKSCQVTKIGGRYERLSRFSLSSPFSEVECLYQEKVLNSILDEDFSQEMDSAAYIVAEYFMAISNNDVNRMVALQAEDFILDFVHRDAFAQEPFKQEEATAFLSAWYKAFPEMDIQVTRTIVANSLVVTEWIFTGTHTGSLGPPIVKNNIPPTGKTIRFRGVSIYEIEQCRIKCLQMYLDMATVLVELGTVL
jgi:steroid delta-isomerase-like uncharacterized protein